MATEKSIGSPKSGHGIEGDSLTKELDGRIYDSEDERLRVSTLCSLACDGTGVGRETCWWIEALKVLSVGETSSVEIGG
jgi:hypothetical protein